MRKTRTIIIATLIGLILLLALHAAKWNPLFHIVQPILSPIESFSYSILNSFGSRLETIRKANELSEELRILQEQNIDLLKEKSQLLQYERENEILRNQISFFEEFGQGNILLAKTIGISSENESIFYINKGSEDGIQEGLPIIAENGIMIGKIISADANISQGLYLSATNSLVSATIQNKERTTQLVQGEHGLSLEMEFIPQDTELLVGDTVITSGREPNIPRGLLIGSIVEVESVVNEPFQRAFLKIPVEYQSQDLVNIILPSI